MSGSYKVIADQEKLKEFLDWLPRLAKDEVFYAALLARSKYVKDLGIGTFNSDRYQCSRFLSNNDRLYKKIWQTEAPINSYEVKGITVPQEALAMYLCPNPRSLSKARSMMLQRVSESIIHRRDEYDCAQDGVSCIHRSVSRRLFVDVDFDDVDIKDAAKELKSFINPEAVKIIETRGGFHALIQTGLVEGKYKRSWYQGVTKMTGTDVVGDTMLPVPGTYQGMFVPVMNSLSHYVD